MSKLYCETAADALAKWDAGESVFTLEMGGLGPGYEQCIHIACFEVVRDLLNEPLPIQSDDAAWKEWSAKADIALRRADKFPGMGMSGAQAGAAKSLAFQLLHGPRTFLEGLKQTAPERAKDIIQVSKEWPRTP